MSARFNNPYGFDVPTHRMVDGLRVELSPAEQQAVLDEWTANQEAKLAEPPPPPVRDLAAELDAEKQRSAQLETRIATLENRIAAGNAR